MSGTMRIVLVGGEFRNKGSEAMVISTVSSLKQLMPDAEFIVASYFQEDVQKGREYDLEVIRNYASLKRVKAIHCLQALLHRVMPVKEIRPSLLGNSNLLRNLAEADLVVDVSGFALTDQFRWRRRLIYYSEILLSKLFGVPFVVYPQAMGPFDKRLSRILARIFLPWVDLMIVRGEITREYLQEIGLGRKRKIHVCADSAFLFEPAPRERVLEILREHGVRIGKKGLIGIVPNMRIYERCKGSRGENAYVIILSRVTEHIRNTLEANVVFIPHEFRSDGIDDGWLIEQIMEETPSKEGVYVIDQEYNSAELKAIIGRLDFLIASRFHSVVASLSMRVPVMVLGWAHKYLELMRMVGQEDHVLDYKDAGYEDLKARLDEKWPKREEIRQKLEIRVPELEQSARTAASMVSELLSSRQEIQVDHTTMNNNVVSITDVPRLNLCTSCGTCAGICPTEALTMVESPKGTYIPVLDESKCSDCDLCIDVCPGHSVDFKSLSLEIFLTLPEDPLVGNVLNSYLAYSTNETLRARGQSGGLISSLLTFALGEKIIDGAVVTRMSRSNPLRPETFIARSKEEVIEASKSKYCPVPAGAIIRTILATEGRLAFVGIPCHIHGLRKAEEVNRRLKDKIKLHLGLFCDRTLNFHFQRHILFKAGVREVEVEGFTYRGKEWRGWPGDLEIQLKNGEKKYLPREWRMQVKPLFTPQRCHLCFDKLNQLADISFGDPWLPEFSSDEKGMSVVISRTRPGDNFILKATDANIIKCEKLPISEIVKGQRLERKQLLSGKYLSASKILADGTPRYGVQLAEATKSSKWGTLVVLLDLLVCKVIANPLPSNAPRYIPISVLGRVNSLRNRILSRFLRKE